MKHMQELHKEYYIEPNYAYLAGPYDTTIKSNRKMLENVVKDLERGNIPHEVREDERGRSQVWRKGMILAIR